MKSKGTTKKLQLVVGAKAKVLRTASGHFSSGYDAIADLYGEGVRAVPSVQRFMEALDARDHPSATDVREALRLIELAMECVAADGGSILSDEQELS